MKAQLAEVVRGEFAMIFLQQGLFYSFQCRESVGIADKLFKKTIVQAVTSQIFISKISTYHIVIQGAGIMIERQHR